MTRQPSQAVAVDPSQWSVRFDTWVLTSIQTPPTEDLPQRLNLSANDVGYYEIRASDQRRVCEHPPACLRMGESPIAGHVQHGDRRPAVEECGGRSCLNVQRSDVEASGEESPAWQDREAPLHRHVAALPCVCARCPTHAYLLRALNGTDWGARRADIRRVALVDPRHRLFASIEPSRRRSMVRTEPRNYPRQAIIDRHAKTARNGQAFEYEDSFPSLLTTGQVAAIRSLRTRSCVSCRRSAWRLCHVDVIESVSRATAARLHEPGQERSPMRRSMHCSDL